MVKQKRNFEIDYPLAWTDSPTIAQLRKDLDELERLGATFVDISGEIEYDCAVAKIQAYVSRFETDDEFNARIAKRKARQELELDE